MGDTPVSKVLQQLNSIIQQQNEQELRLVSGVKEAVNKLSATLKAIQSVLEDAEEKQLRDKDVKVWLEEVKDAAYELDDILDDWSTHQILKSKIEEEKKNKKKKKKKKKKKMKNQKKVSSTYLYSPCICFNHVFSHHDSGHKIKEIRKKLDSLANEKGKYCLVQKSSSSRGVIKEEELAQQRQHLIKTTVTCMTDDDDDDVSEYQIYGRDTDKDVIISKLVSESSQQGIGLHVIPIVGMGGLGKTTVAQLVFNDNRVTSHFDKRVWVHVSSKNFDAINIAKAIIEAIGESAPPCSLAWESLQLHLHNSIKGKRVLLVLDNIWGIEDPIKWGALQFSLNYGALGSRILVTTRSEKVALTMGAINPYHLQPLSDDQCFLLFRYHLAFSGKGEKEQFKQFEDIGKEIAKKCRGVPLAAKMLGCLMRFKSTREEWVDILESETWKFQSRSVLPAALLLSYYDLPSPIKCCFGFCAIFPKDHWIHKDNLIKLWMSQGFLGIDGRKELELIGAECFDNLVMRSFFQDLRKDKDGHIYCCKMHDLVHDLAQFITDKECFLIERKSNNDGDQLYYNKKCRHLSLVSGEEVMNSIPVSLHSVKLLHTLKLLGEISVITLPPILFGYMTCLRALDLSKTKLTELPTDVVKLIHLRYLDLSMTDVKELPETLTELCNLQTLKLDNCEYLSKLPQGIGKLINLRHLEIENTVCLNCLPQEIGRLTSLRTLSRFFATEGCKIGELKNLNLLQGRLKITRLKRVANKSESYEAGLKNKQDVHSLVLEFSDDSLGGVKEVERMEDVLQGLEPHPNLEKLSIYEYPGFKLPSWMSDNSTLSNLWSLSLSCCWKLRQLPPTLWKLPFLEILEIDRLPNWEEWTMEVEQDGAIISTTILPCLRNLVITSCPKLKTMPALGRLASLESIKIEGLHGLTRLGCEIYGICGGDGGSMKGSFFPKLKELTFSFMSNLEEWELGVEGKEIEIMPSLRILKLYKCPKLSVVLATGALVSLEQFSLLFLRKIKYIGQVYGGGGSDGDDLFPELESLEFGGMENLEECESRREIIEDQKIMPCLRSLVLWHCPMLVAPPHHLFLLPHTSPPLLRKLVIGDCPLLSWMQQPPSPPSSYVLLPFLEELEVLYNAGSLSRSLISPDDSQMLFLNLKSLILTGSPHTSLPQGIGQLAMLQRLTIRSCNRMTHMSEETQNLAMLRELRILYCEILGPRCQEGAADWGKISHIPSIIIDGVFVERQ